jgi:nicotinate-nucleotide pyrophosphorylase (carboxylating)
MSNSRLTPEQIDSIIELALAEDLSYGDVTSEALVPTELEGRASFLAEVEGVLAGIEVARQVFHKVDPSLRFEINIADGTRIKRGDIIASVSGNLISVLKAERTALNFLQRLSGTATLTSNLIAKVEGLSTKIMDTRKTTPGMRLLEKYAVRMGGGKTHRLHLGDWILIKDNHLIALRALGMTIKDIVSRAKYNAPQDTKVEIEVTNAEEAMEAANSEADIIMLDNMTPDEMRHAVSQLPKHIKTEASGGISMDTIHKVAESGVDYISIGAVTHSVKALNISLELERPDINS